MNDTFKSIIYSFPVQLVFHQIRRNLTLVLLWILLISTIAGGIGKIYGIHFLYLDPEYMGRVGFWSFFIVGLAFGNFTMAYQITCYILDGHRFTFIGILERPFAKFSINNSILPLITLIIYIILIIRFQLSNEFSTSIDLIVNLVGLLVGVGIMILLFFYYFKFTNKDIFKYLAGSVDKRLRKARISRERMMNKLNETRSRKYNVHHYLDLKLRVRSCKGLDDFYDKEAVLKVFDQNHFNSVIVEIAIIVLIILLGSFMDNPYFQIPAAASSLFLFSFLLMMVGAFSYWLRGWGMAAAFGLFVLINFLLRTGIINNENAARGLKYDGEKVAYSLHQLENLNSNTQQTADSLQVIEVLDRWKRKQVKEHPRMVILCVSGGGQRAALWSLNALHAVDSAMQSQLMDHVALITGASGGMIGAAYYRELFHLQKQGVDIPNKKVQLKRMGADNLNAIIFSLLVNDSYFRFRSYEYGGEKYLKDRGFVFEENLNKNLGGIFSKRLMDYQKPELSAEIPMMLLSPVISNDGRKLYTSPLGFSFMNHPANRNNWERKISGVGFRSLFSRHGANQLSFLTALRMSASFPYITPTVSLPSEPAIEVMDAGIADNYGVGDAVKFVSQFKEWINQNTSGVTFLVIRDSRKNAPIEAQSSASIVGRLTNPIASVYNNLGNIQDSNNDASLERLRACVDQPINLVSIEYNTYTNITEDYLLQSKALERKELERASLSWHLTTKEKRNIIDNIMLPSNQRAIQEFQRIIE